MNKQTQVTARISLRSKHPYGGFTLIEVLVALAIISIALSALVGASTRATQALAHRQEHLFAHWVAINQWTKLRYSINSGSSRNQGKTQFAGQKWFWTQRTETTKNSSISRVEISAGLLNGQSSASITAYIRQPQQQAER